MSRWEETQLGRVAREPFFLFLASFSDCQPISFPFLPVYAEHIECQRNDITSSESESMKMLSSVTKETAVWFIGGTNCDQWVASFIYTDN